MASRVISVRKEKGVIYNMSEILSTVKLWLNDIMNGEWLLVLEKRTRPRTNEQNRLMWLWFSAIADVWSDATGRVFTRQNVHDAYCELFLPIDTPKGTIAGSTSTLTTAEFTEFLERVRADAASEYGIMLPDPDDYQFEAWARMHEGR